MARLDIQRMLDGSIEQLQLRPGNNRVRVAPGHQFRLDRDEVDAAQLRVLRVDSDLVIEGVPAASGAAQGTAVATIILEGYYRTCSAADRCTVSVDDGSASADAVAAGELGSTGVVLADVGTQPLGALSDGDFVLYDPGFQAPTLPMLDEGSTRPLLYGLGGAAVLGLALGGGGGGGGDSGGQTAQGNLALAVRTGNVFNTRFPTISGTAEAGTDVQIRIDTDADQRADVTYATTADSSGNWSVNLQTAQPGSGTLPARGLSDSNTMEVVGTLNGVQASLPATTLTFDNTPPAQADISPVAGDSIITAAERAAGVTFSGTSEANGSVELKVGNTTRLVAVDADGRWSTSLAAAELPDKDGGYTVTVTALDAAGNRGPANTTRITMNTAGKQSVIGNIAGPDDTVNAAEAAAPIRIDGLAEPGATLTLRITNSRNQVTELPVQATTDAGGAWSTHISLPATLADGKYTLSATSITPAGNTATGTREFTVDRTAPNTVTRVGVEGGDTTITSQEARDGVNITGSAEAGATVTVAVTGGKTATTTAAADGTWKVTLHDTDLPAVESGSTKPATLSITAEDKAGNVSAPVQQNLTLQGAPADTGGTGGTTITGPLTADNIVNETEDDRITITGTAQPGASVALSVDNATVIARGTANAQGQWSIDTGLTAIQPQAGGPHTLIATATVAGSTDKAEARHEFTIDRVVEKPTGITYDGHASPIITDAERRDGVILTGKAEANAILDITVAGKTQTGIKAGADGSWTSAPFEMPAAATGGSQKYGVSFNVTDGAGNGPTRFSGDDITIQGPSPVRGTPGTRGIGADSTTKGLPGGSRLSLAELLDQGQQDIASLPGTQPSAAAPDQNGGAGAAVGNTTTGVASATATATGAHELAATGSTPAPHTTSATVHSLTALQQPWEHPSLA